MRDPGSPPIPSLSLLAALLVLANLGPESVLGAVNFNFEQRYFVEPGFIAADHAILVADGEFHLIYTVGRQGEGWGEPGNMVDFGHASSPDLVDWTVHPHVIPIDPPGWKERNVWAPHIMRSFGIEYLIYYTGVDSTITQQIGVAYSDDLFDWSESSNNPIYKPDTTWADWQPGQWSNCRDPFVMRLSSGRYAMLTTASTKPGYQGIPEARGAIGLAYGDFWGQWRDSGAPLFINDSFRVIESTYMVERNGIFYLFYNEGGVPGIHYMTSSERFSGWDKSNAQLFEFDGFAAEVFERNNQWLFARVRDGLWDGLSILGIKVDPLTWDGGTPIIGEQNRLFDNWTIISGDAFDLQPTFGDQPAERNGYPSNIEGFFWIATAEQHAGPLAWGCPGCPPDESRTGILRSNEFVIEDDYLAFRMGGGDDIDNLYLSLHLVGGGELRRVTGHGSDVMLDRSWDVRQYIGRSVYLEIADLSATGHVNIDWIHGTDTPPVTGVADQPVAAITPLRALALATPGPAPHRFRITLDRAAPLRLSLFDASGRQVRAVDLGRFDAGVSEVSWDGRANDGVRVPHGVYFYRLDAPHAEARGRLVLVP